MKRLERSFYLLTILALVILLTLEKCKKTGKIQPCPEVVGTVTKVDTVKGSSKGYTPIPAKKDTVWMKGKDIVREIGGQPFWYAVHDTIKIKDSSQVFAVPVNIYKDTLRFDTLGFAVVIDTTAGVNIGRSFTWNINKITTTKTIAKKLRNKWFYGIEAVGNQEEPVQYFGGMIGIQGKKTDNIIIGGAGVMNGNVHYKAGVLYKISFR